jgi:hypothetical protein
MWQRNATDRPALLNWCPAVLDDKLTALKDDEPQYAEHCIEQRRTAIAAIAKDPHIEAIFLISAWTNLVRYRINAGDQLSDRIEAFRAALARLLDDLAPLQRRIVVVGDVPQWSSDPIACAITNLTNLLRRPYTNNATTVAYVRRFQGPIQTAIAAETAAPSSCRT